MIWRAAGEVQLVTVFWLSEFYGSEGERNEWIWGSEESVHKMAAFLELMLRDRVNTLMMEATVTSETFVHV